MKSTRATKASNEKAKAARSSVPGLAGLQRGHGHTLGLEGALAGAAVGAMGGPVGIVAGGAIGGLVGAVADGMLAEDRAADTKRDAELDQIIGVSGGDIGAAKRGQPPARVGAFSSASSGGESSHGVDSSGPIQDVDE